MKNEFLEEFKYTINDYYEIEKYFIKLLENNDIEKIRKFFEVDITYSFASFTYLIIEIIKYNNTEALKIYLESEFVDQSYSSEPFKTAIQYNASDCFKILLADKSKNPSSDSEQVLIEAVIKNNVEVVKLLLEDKRVDPSVLNNNALTLSSDYLHFDIFKLLFEDSRTEAKHFAILTNICNFEDEDYIIEVYKKIINNYPREQLSFYITELFLKSASKRYFKLFDLFLNTFSFETVHLSETTIEILFIEKQFSFLKKILKNDVVYSKIKSSNPSLFAEIEQEFFKLNIEEF